VAPDPRAARQGESAMFLEITDLIVIDTVFYGFG
jgi:hypothetical protein